MKKTRIYNNKVCFTKRKVGQLTTDWFDRGRKAGRKELAEEIITLLGLDDRYKFIDE